LVASDETQPPSTPPPGFSAGGTIEGDYELIDQARRRPA
jgi:hypothetical protein